MNYIKYSLAFCLFLFCYASTYAQEKQLEDAAYTYKDPDPGGTGKVYMGREIAMVMSFQGKDWLERDSRPQEENTDLAISKLPVTKNSVVADIGAGTGYYTFRIAQKVSEGKVYAVEIQDDAIQYLKVRSNKLKANHVEPIRGGEKSPNLPDNSVDLAIMVDVYHELLYPQEMLEEIKQSLRPNGKLLLIEYRGEDPKVGIKKLHKMTVKQINKELTANGFHLVQNGQFMRIQHFLVYEKD
ncbi:MAG: class I SAM-dependent methyltransferase [Anditalea sp.]